MNERNTDTKEHAKKRTSKSENGVDGMIRTLQFERFFVLPNKVPGLVFVVHLFVCFFLPPKKPLVIQVNDMNM